MSVYLKLAETAVARAGFGALRASKARRTKLAGHIVVRMHDPAKRRIYVGFNRGGKHAMVYGDIGDLENSMPMFAQPFPVPASKRNFRCVFIRDVR